MKTVYKFVSIGLGLRIQTDLFLGMTELLNVPSLILQRDSGTAVLSPKALNASRIM